MSSHFFPEGVRSESPICSATRNMKFFRRRPFLSPRARILVVCEGKKTEPNYLRSFKHNAQCRLVDVEVIGEGAVPKTVVERAVELKKKAEQEARRSRDAFRKYDEAWCVFDVDAHPNLNEAKQQAQANGLLLAVSNPCFELWLILHFQDQHGHIERVHARAECRWHMPGYDKDAPIQILMPRYTEAVQRANDLDRWQIDQGRPGANPSTGVHKLTERIKELGKDSLLRKQKDLRCQR